APTRRSEDGGGLPQTTHGVDVRVEVGKPGPAGTELEVRHSHLAKGERSACPVVRGAGGRDAAFDADAAGIAPGFAYVAPEPFETRAARLIRREMREPSVRQPSDALDRDLFVGAHPQRDGALDRQRIDAGAIDPMPGAGGRHDLGRT